MTDNKTVLVPIGLAHRNYRTFIAPELLINDKWAGNGNKFDDDIELKSLFETRRAYNVGRSTRFASL